MLAPIMMKKPQAATSMPRPIFLGLDGSRLRFASQLKTPTLTGVSITTKQGLNCWKMGAYTATSPLRFVYCQPR